LVPGLTDANRKWWICGTMTLALSMILIDQTVVSVALPTIQHDLGFSETGLQWVVNAYLLAIAAFVAVGGRLGDMWGNDRIFKLGASVFVLSSVACGLAGSEAVLLAARAVEGLGAAMMIPATGAIVLNAFAPQERGKAMGVYAGVSMIFLALGPLVGGILTQDVTWRAVFWINVPLGAIMLLVAHVTVPRSERLEGARVDWVGLATIVPGLTLFVLGLMESHSWGWGSVKTIGCLAVGLGLLVVFAFAELRIAQPLIQLRLFRSHNFSGDAFVLFCVEFSLIGLTVFGAVWVQTVLGFDPIDSGLSLLPLTIPLLFVAPVVGRVYDRIGPRGLVSGGCLLVAASLFWSAALLSKQSYEWLIPGYLAMGIGIGMVMSPTNTDALNTAPPKDRGEASGVIQTLRQVGGAVGLALMGTVVNNVQQDHITSFVTANPDQAGAVQNLLTHPETPSAAAKAGISPSVLSAVHDAVTAATSASYWVAGGVMAAAVLAAYALLRHVLAADAPAPVHPATVPAPRGAQVRVSQA
jgi:EmrB/QacA subfamily drug resistance transporter